MRRLLGVRWFLFESGYAPVFVDFNHAKLFCRFVRGNLNRADCHIRAGINMLLQHFGVIHLVNVIAGKDKHVLRTLAADGINILVHGVRRPLIPLFRNAHLRRQNLYVFAESGKS